MTGLTPSLIIALAIFASNLPFFTERLLMLLLLKSPKPLWLRLLEWAIYGLVVFFIAQTIEASLNLANYPQSGEFYWVLCIGFVTFAFPGFVYRYLWLPTPTTPTASDTTGIED
jgi:hypothetical protein